MSEAALPAGYRFESLRRDHPRKQFDCGLGPVNDWLATKALQNQDKRLSSTRVLLDAGGVIAGYYTLATGQVDFSDLPAEVARGLPRRALPVACLAWLGARVRHQKQGLGRLLLARALRDCHEAGKTFAFIAVILDCLTNEAKAFYSRFDCRELPGHPHRLVLSSRELDALMEGE